MPTPRFNSPPPAYHRHPFFVHPAPAKLVILSAAKEPNRATHHKPTTCTHSLPAPRMLFFPPTRGENVLHRPHPIRSHRRHEGKGRAPPQRPPHGQIRAETQRNRKNARARRPRIPSSPANPRQAAPRIRRTIHQRRPLRSRRKREKGNRLHRTLSTSRSQ